MIEYRQGDLFTAGLPALAHGCNCQGVMGAGIAVQFRDRWPGMYEAYRQRCQWGEYIPGDVMPWRDLGTGTVIFNLATQYHPGADATAAALRASLARIDKAVLMDKERDYERTDGNM